MSIPRNVNDQEIQIQQQQQQHSTLFAISGIEQKYGIIRDWHRKRYFKGHFEGPFVVQLQNPVYE